MEEIRNFHTIEATIKQKKNENIKTMGHHEYIMQGFFQAVLEYVYHTLGRFFTKITKPQVFKRIYQFFQKKLPIFQKIYQFFKKIYQVF